MREQGGEVGDEALVVAPHLDLPALLGRTGGGGWAHRQRMGQPAGLNPRQRTTVTSCIAQPCSGMQGAASWGRPGAVHAVPQCTGGLAPAGRRGTGRLSHLPKRTARALARRICKSTEGRENERAQEKGKGRRGGRAGGRTHLGVCGRGRQVVVNLRGVWHRGQALAHRGQRARHEVGGAAVAKAKHHGGADLPGRGRDTKAPWVLMGEGMRHRPPRGDITRRESLRQLE